MKHIYHYLIIGVLLLGVGMGQVGANTIPAGVMLETYTESGNLDPGGGNTGTATGAFTEEINRALGTGSQDAISGGGIFDTPKTLEQEINTVTAAGPPATTTPATGAGAAETGTAESTTEAPTTTTPTTAAPSRGLRPQGKMSQPFRPEGVRVPLPSAENSDVRGLLNVYIPSIINFFIGIIAIVAIFMIIWGGYQFLMAQGDTAKVEAAIKTIEWSTTGLTIALLSYIIVQIVVNINIIS